MNGGTRRLNSPHGDGSLSRETEANAELLLVISLCQLASELSVYFSIENPANSYMFHTPESKSMLKQTNSQIISFDQCCFGLKFPDSKPDSFCKKLTALLTNMHSLAKLAQRCPGISRIHQHTYAWGAMKASDVLQGPPLKRAAAAGAYPPKLRSAWANLVVEALSEGEARVPRRLIRSTSPRSNLSIESTADCGRAGDTIGEDPTFTSGQSPVASGPSTLISMVSSL